MYLTKATFIRIC